MASLLPMESTSLFKVGDNRLTTTFWNNRPKIWIKKENV